MDDNANWPDLSLFLAAAAHDMKNSVSMLSGTLENLLADDSVKMTPAFKQMGEFAEAEQVLQSAANFLQIRCCARKTSAW